MTPRSDMTDSGDDSSGGSMAGHSAGGGRQRLSKNSDEYRMRRERNNQAVKKSRAKSKLKTQQMMEKVTKLKDENEKLEDNIKILSKELSILKDIFLQHAGNDHGVRICEDELTRMLCEDDLGEGAALLMNLSRQANT